MPDLTYYWTVVSFLLGAVIGSFLNVVIYRLPRAESLVRPGSHCPNCGAGIAWYDNVPMVSWLILGGRCRHCRGSISLRYPGVESLTAVVFALSYWRLGLSWSLLVAWVFLGAVLVSAFIEYDHSLLPGRVVWPLAAVGFTMSVAVDPGQWWAKIVGAVGVAGLTAAIWRLAWRRGRVSATARIGGLKMAVLIGAVLGLAGYLAVAVAMALGLGFLGYLALRKTSPSSMVIGFTPFLSGGAVVALLTGEYLLKGYWSF